MALSWTTQDGTRHERCKLLWFVGDAFLGESFYDPGDAAQLGYRRGGTAWFCHHCGEVWARVVCVAPSTDSQWFQEIASVSCERHPDQWNTPGSLLSGPRNEGLIDWMPAEVLRREIEVNFRQMEKSA